MVSANARCSTHQVWIEQFDARTLAFDPRTGWMTMTVPGGKRRRRIASMLVAVAKFVSNVIQSDQESGGEREPPESTDLSIAALDVLVALIGQEQANVIFSAFGF